MTYYSTSDLRWRYQSWSEDDTVELGGVPVPRTFTVRLDHPLWPASADLTVTVYRDRGPVATGLTVIDPESNLPDPPGYRELDDVIGRTIDRGRLLEEVTAQAAGWRISWQLHEELIGRQELSEEERAERVREIGSMARGVTEAAYGTTRPRRRSAITDQLLRHVADLYREAVAAGQAPRPYIAEKVGKSSSTVATYIGLARKRIDPATGETFLGPATGRRAGEQRGDDQ